MANWLAAQIVPKEHEWIAKSAKRVGSLMFYPRWRKTTGRQRTVEVGPLYPGYAFFKSLTERDAEHSWYSILECCSAVVAIVAMALEVRPLTSDAMDRHVDRLVSSRDADGFVPAPKEKRNSFLRGDRVHVENKFFTGDARFVRLRNGGGVEVDAGFTTFVVHDHEVLKAA